jgi:hypothetical protein
VVLDHGQEAGEVVAAEVQEQAFELEGGGGGGEVEGEEGGEVAACGLCGEE